MDRESKLIFEAYALKGLAAGKTLADIAKKHGVSIEVMQTALQRGMKVEHEHTGNEAAAKKIAMDHLFEDPEYYAKLAKIEGEESEQNEERRLDPKCWKGYHKSGTKLKDGVRVNNCVKSQNNEEKLVGGQKKLDANHDGKISGADFKILKKHKGEEQEEMQCPYAAKGCKCSECEECAANQA